LPTSPYLHPAFSHSSSPSTKPCPHPFHRPLGHIPRPRGRAQHLSHLHETLARTKAHHRIPHHRPLHLPANTISQTTRHPRTINRQVLHPTIRPLHRLPIGHPRRTILPGTPLSRLLGASSTSLAPPSTALPQASAMASPPLTPTPHYSQSATSTKSRTPLAIEAT
jgi:hypothetical protein